MHILAGIHVAKGNPSKIFSPFLLLRNLKASPENIKDKLLVNFDPLRCYSADLQVSDLVCFDMHIPIVDFCCLSISMKM